MSDSVSRNHLIVGSMAAGMAVIVLFVFSLAVPSNVSAKLIVNTNAESVKALKVLNETNKKLSEVFTRISKSLGIHQASDDSAGLGMAESMDADYRAILRGMQAATDAVSVIQTAEGAANEVANILKRMRELAVQSASETLATDEREFIADEFEQLKEELDAISFDGVQEDGDDVIGRSPSVLKTRDCFLKRMGAVNEQILGIVLKSEDDEFDDDEDVGEGESDELLPEQQIDIASKAVVAALSELTRASDVIVRSADKTIKAAERKIQKLELQRKKSQKVKPKPKR